ncbi:ECF transporter S component [uncultured Subdoligranulum sp.]|uniref:ECF transporter S component n=1 Tax=uncultured Subdoligranulum sp. TaxID=512298 RepID=UPI0025F7E0E3|nr:ECF transporter S component [uncultured Subdoligranulum sp.]
MNTREKTYKLVLTALFLALCLVLPFVTGGIPTIGNMLLPMHIPVLLCGLLCGWQYGLVIGFVAPLLRSTLFGMPPIYPVALAMAFELAAYGLIIGLVYTALHKRGLAALYGSLLVAMVGGRLVWGVAEVVLLGMAGNAFTLQAFLSGALLTAVPGIVLQLVLIPAVMVALDRTGVVRFQNA